MSLLIHNNTQEKYLVHFLTTKNASSTMLDVSEPSSSESILTACDTANTLNYDSMLMLFIASHMNNSKELFRTQYQVSRSIINSCFAFRVKSQGSDWLTGQGLTSH